MEVNVPHESCCPVPQAGRARLLLGLCSVSRKAQHSTWWKRRRGSGVEQGPSWSHPPVKGKGGPWGRAGRADADARRAVRAAARWERRRGGEDCPHQQRLLWPCNVATSFGCLRLASCSAGVCWVRAAWRALALALVLALRPPWQRAAY